MGLREQVASQGLIFQPWQIAAFVTAARTKPFIILAGISGTGKTRITSSIASLTGAEFKLAPVKPDWTDSSDLLGYEPLSGAFRPGPLLRFAKGAAENPNRENFFLLDEMNIARVEYYFAEVLSILEDRHREVDGSVRSKPLLNAASSPGIETWADVSLPENLVIVGSVNMDETTHAFSKKVLDRAFVLEFSDIDLGLTGAVRPTRPVPWGSAEWRSQHLSLAEVAQPWPGEVTEVITALTKINDILKPIQAQVGYRVRDEVALFCLNAKDCISSFVTSEGATVDPLDLALCMKVLPRLGGSGQALKEALETLASWASGSNALGRQFVMCEDRLRQMNTRLDDDGFTSYWL